MPLCALLRLLHEVQNTSINTSNVLMTVRDHIILFNDVARAIAYES